MIAALLDHLWQSTIFAAGIGLLTLALRGNPARIRYRLWFLASVKFLVPFSLLQALGGALAPAMPPAAMPDLYFIQRTTEPFAAAAPSIVLPTPHGLAPPMLLLLLWLCGFSAVLLVWFVRWLRMRLILRDAVSLRVAAPVEVKCTASSLGPGLFGIFRPVLLLPQGITSNLTKPEMRAILDHELCHLERNDNLTAAIHLIVEAIFWFHPLVWWLGARLIAERENACDENVVENGNEAGTYAEGILKVCRFYAGPPPPLAAAVLSAGLEGRLESIMASRAVAQLSRARKALIGICALIALAWPLAGGWTGAVQNEIALIATPVAGDDAVETALRRYVAQHQAGQGPYDGGHWYENTTSRTACESHFRAVLLTLEKSYGKFAPLYPQRAKNDQDQLPISLTWKNGLGDSRYQEATVYMSAETAHVWDARRLLAGHHIDAAASWSADSENAKSICLTEIDVSA